MSDLRRLAEAATPGPWAKQDDGAGSVYVDSRAFASGPEPVAGIVSMSTPDAAYIAACSPDAILALLDERDRLRAELARLRGLVGNVDTNEARVWRDGRYVTPEEDRPSLPGRIEAAVAASRE